MKALVLSLFLLLGQEPQQLDIKQLNCLAKVVYHEARGEPTRGQEAVAHVVVNRTEDPLFPKNYCDVAYQPHQFTDILKSKPNQNSEAWKNSVKVAMTVMLGTSEDPTKGAKYFYAQNLVKPQWARNKQKIVIGNHTFL